MATGAIFAQGTLLQLGDGGTSEVFTTIAEVLSLTGPTLTRDTIDVTNQSSTGGFREFINGLKDGGEVSFDLNYIPTEATHDASTGLLADYESGVSRNFKLIFPDTGATTWLFTGVVRDFQISAEVDSQLRASCVIKVSGAPTLV